MGTAVEAVSAVEDGVAALGGKSDDASKRFCKDDGQEGDGQGRLLSAAVQERFQDDEHGEDGEDRQDHLVGGDEMGGQAHDEAETSLSGLPSGPKPVYRVE